MWDDLFDKTFREKSNEGLPQLDKKAMWAALEKDLDKNKRKNGFAWIWFFGGLLLLSTLSVVVGINHQQYVSNKFVKTDLPLQQKADHPVTNQKTNISDKTENYTIKPLDENSVKSSKEGYLSEASNKQFTETPKPIDLNQTTKKAYDSKYTKVLNNSDNVLETSSANEINNETSITLNQETAIEELIVSEKVQIRDNLISPILPTLGMIPSASIAVNQLETSIMNQPIVVLPKASNKWSVSVTSGFVYFNKSISQVNPELSDFVDFKDNSETEDFGITARLLVGYKIRPNFHVRAGLQYLTLYERFEYDRTIESETSVFSQNAFAYERKDGSVQTFSGDVPAIDATHRQIGHTNKHNLWSSIIEAGYSKKVGKLNAELKTGFSAVLVHNFTGKTIDKDLVPIVIDNENSSDLTSHRNALSGFWHAGAGLALPISRRISVKADINYNLGLSPVNKNIEDYKLSYKYYDGSIGLNYAF
jgi:hypothetical protein